MLSFRSFTLGLMSQKKFGDFKGHPGFQCGVGGIFCQKLKNGVEFEEILHESLKIRKKKRIREKKGKKGKKEKS